jgi:hypothetical protein
MMCSRCSWEEQTVLRRVDIMHCRRWTRCTVLRRVDMIYYMMRVEKMYCIEERRHDVLYEDEWT